MNAVGGQRGADRRYRRFAVALVYACGLLCDAAGAQSAAPQKPTTHTVVIEGVAYAPESLTIKRGDTVVWINKDPFPHTVTAKGSFDSHSIGSGKSWKLTLRTAGDYAYICSLHPNMKGALKVQ